MDYKNIQELIKSVSDSQITSFEIDTEGITIKMEKKEQQVVLERIPLHTPPVEQVINETLTLRNIEAPEMYIGKLQNAALIIPEENIFIVKSPIVGTMYSSPSAESKNFVKVGSKIKIGDTLCILEAMKLMNQIESEVDGEVVEVLVSNEDIIEYGQPLFKIMLK
ncbi:acetyl-CoA carboxylase biotin carboxyl carrier protein [Clostridium lacusfryxellense]|uniref:acetyl-CoA carboxylase biotin carboxyl carrier protein n=1 Tax=Clostridium lacusfryxellense TaxID=205328 RepID=UPI001C0B825B|nr:acetyl-CoA carboxylase biotin carboxyl carrier protein [Clostridium lacusfryxellense]MBU3112560.1 acetyl-CoA carboxylase biotin carboxyl carrier protein [Clostridium lacusfryxellense]